MLNVEILCVGRVNADFIKKGIEEYIKRTSPYAKINVVELAEVKQNDAGETGERIVIEAEGERILSCLEKKNAAVVAMCVEGKKLSSKGLSEYIEKTMNVASKIVFVIGGSLGLSDAVKKRADMCLSMSDMTFPHQLFRLMLCEQLYRAITIINNIKYHK